MGNLSTILQANMVTASVVKTVNGKGLQLNKNMRSNNIDKTEFTATKNRYKDAQHPSPSTRIEINAHLARGEKF